MNLNAFLSEVDTLVAGCSFEQLAAFLHETARSLLEDQRITFRDELRRASELTPAQCSLSKSEDPSASLSETCMDAKETLEEIELGDRSLVMSINEDGSRNRYGHYVEFPYTDPEGIMADLVEICQLLHTLVDNELYELASDLGEHLFDLKIPVSNLAGDDDFDVTPTEARRLLDENDEDHRYEGLDLHTAALDTLYAMYRWQKTPISTMFHIMQVSGIYDLHLKDFLQPDCTDPELLQAFLQRLLLFLKDASSSPSSSLYKDALLLLSSAEEQARWARTCAATHPEGYFVLLQQDHLSPGFRLSLGQDALKEIDPSRPVRSQCALETADLALSLGNPDLAARCLEAAFESDPTPENYLRVLLNCSDPEQVRSRLDWDRILSRSRNPAMVLFLKGDFSDAYQKFRASNAFSNIECLFLEHVIPLFLPTLYPGSRFPLALSQLLKQTEKCFAFQPARYLKGLPEQSEDTLGDLFLQCFDRWKKLTSVPPDFRATVLEDLGPCLDQYIRSLTQSGLTDYYAKGALFAAALGEVQEAFGDNGAKERILRHFIATYPRHYKLRAPLKQYL